MSVVLNITSVKNNVLKIGGGERGVEIKGSGFVLDEDENEHDLQLVVDVLNAHGTAAEDKSLIKVSKIKEDDLSETDFIVKIEVLKKEDPDDDTPVGERALVLREASVELEADGTCPHNSICKRVENKIVIEK